MHKYILFDLDGTLVNTFQGIYNSYQFALKEMNHGSCAVEVVNDAIGAPLTSVFRNTFNFNEHDTKIAVDYYRDYYEKYGVHEVTLYDGVEDTLKKLCANGCHLAVATLKRESFAKKMLSELDFTKYFDVIYGIDENDKLTKADLLNKCVDTLKADKTETILVGDSSFDMIGAKEAGIDFMAVMYGFGFKGISPFKDLQPTFIANTGYEIISKLESTE